jgi:hypothetical protein
MRQCACHIKMAPAVWEHPGTRPTGGDPVDTTKFSATARPTTEEKRLAAKRLAKLEEQLAHELMSDEKRQELRDRVRRARRSVVGV